MSIENRGDNKWRFRVNKNGQKFTMNFVGTEKQAIKAHETFKVDVDRGQIGVNENIKFFELCQLVMDEYVKVSCRENTIISYRHNYNNRLIPYFGNRQVGKITPLEIQKYCNQLSTQKLKPSSIKRNMAILRTTLTMAEKWGFINESPYKHIVLPKEGRSRKDELYSMENIQSLFSLICQLPADAISKCPMLLALGCGMRCGEIRALTLNDINFEDGIINVDKQVMKDDVAAPTKTEGSVRKIYAPKFVMDALREYFFSLSRIPESKHLFYNFSTGKPVSKSLFGYHLHDLLEQNNMPQIRFHDLRHLTATLLIMNNVDIKTVASILGHNDIKTTLQVYTSMLSQNNKSAAQTMDTIFKNQ